MRVLGIESSCDETAAALVDGDGPVAGSRNSRQLEAPGKGQLGEAVQEDDRFSLALLVDGEADAVGLDKVRSWEHFKVFLQKKGVRWPDRSSRS